MKKAILFALAIAGAVLVACENEDHGPRDLNVVICDDEPGEFCGGDQPRRPR